MAFKRLRGFKDIYGQEAELFARAEAEARRVFSLFGFEEMRTPALEEKQLFSRALGDDTDVVQKEMYEFEDRSKVQVALRPEGTASVVRSYLENNFHKTQGLAKFFYLGAMFRSERPQAGRLRQFHQVGVEALGTDSPYADAETIHCLTAFLDAVGVQGYEVKLNNLGTFEERDQFKKELRKFFEPHKKALCEDCQKRLEKNVFRLLDCKVRSCHAIVVKSPPIDDFLDEASKQHYRVVCQALESAGIPYTQDSYMVRGLDYYTKTVFEVIHPKLGAQDAIAAGGRYDKLVESFGGKSAGAVGFAVGVERLLMCFEEEQTPSDQRESSIFIATLGEVALQEGYRILSILRANGLQAFMDFQAKSLKSQMRAADRNRCRYVMILGEDELKKGLITFKDMGDSSQKEIEIKAVVDVLSKLIPA